MIIALSPDLTFIISLSVRLILTTHWLSLEPKRNTGEPEPAICCKGTLNWVNVGPGNTVTGTFEVGNCGETCSTLNWKVTDWPTWGTWSFSPSSGSLPAGSWVTVTATVVAPNQQNQVFQGNVTVCNTDDSTDCCLIPVHLETPRSREINSLFLNFLQQHPNLLPILRYLLGL